MTSQQPGSARDPQAALPPHSLESEQAILGAILLSEKAHYAFVVEEEIKARDFYRARHRVIFEALLGLFDRGNEIDVLTVTEELKSLGKLDDAGGEEAIQELVTAVPAVGNLRRYAEIVRETAHLRRLLDTSYRIQSSVYTRDGDPQQIVDEAERSILEIRMGDGGQDFRAVGDVLHQELQRWDELAKRGESITGVPSGFADLDQITGGFQPGNLIIIAARPSMGKSALVTNIAENVALNKKNPRAVALFSLEMSEGELAQRFIASQAAIKGDDLRKGRVRDEKWQRVLKVAGEYERSKLYVDDSSDIGLLDIRAKARRLHQALHDEGGLGLVIIDYLQLMRADTRYDSRVQQVGEMSRGLKILARELKVPVIALSQLSRGVESRTDKRPMLSDLRESGQIEQDADLVMFIYRDEYYNHEASEDPGVSEILIAKHRNGALGNVKLTFQHEYPRFRNIAIEVA